MPLINEYEYADVINNEGDLVIRGNQMMSHYELAIKNDEVKKIAKIWGIDNEHFLYFFIDEISGNPLLDYHGGMTIKRLIKICDEHNIKYEYEIELV